MESNGVELKGKGKKGINKEKKRNKGAVHNTISHHAFCRGRVHPCAD